MIHGCLGGSLTCMHCVLWQPTCCSSWETLNVEETHKPTVP